MNALAVEVRQATVEDLDLLAPLFDGYRQFYRQASDQDGARRFLRDRFEHNQSVIFLALADGVACGFTQLYPSFSSTGMARIFVLNDLFVVPVGRGRGTGRALLEAAAAYGRRVGALRLGLSTEVNNTTAQRLYEGMGWKRDTAFYSYQLML
jgi:GNAT superfamily N-acetyltransferase